MIICYTCITNGKDNLKSWDKEDGVRYICFNDGTVDCTNTIWENHKLVHVENDPRRTSRYHKIMAHKVLPDHTWSMWIDGSLLPKVRIQDLINRQKGIPNGSYGVRLHPGWNCIYKEAQAIASYGFEDINILSRVVKRYKEEGMPENYGLHETGILVRENIPQVNEFNELWWKEVSENSKRDQMSFDYLRWKTGKQFSNLARGWFEQERTSHFGHKHGE